APGLQRLDDAGKTIAVARPIAPAGTNDRGVRAVLPRQILCHDFGTAIRVAQAHSLATRLVLRNLSRIARIAVDRDRTEIDKASNGRRPARVDYIACRVDDLFLVKPPGAPVADPGGTMKH